MGFTVFPSKLLENAVNEFSSLPGIGRKTALRLVMNLLRREPGEVIKFGETIMRLRSEIRYCSVCRNISDEPVCSICNDKSRDNKLLCVVENIQDVMAIENTRQYHGLYHVLGGVISPMEGIGPSELNIDTLEGRAASGEINEMIFALSTTMEGDTTNYYLYRRLSKYKIKLSILASGVAVGNELEYTDELTLGRSIINRVPFNLPAS